MGCETMLKEKSFPVGLESTAILWYSFSFVWVIVCKWLTLQRIKSNQKSFILHTHKELQTETRYKQNYFFKEQLMSMETRFDFC